MSNLKSVFDSNALWLSMLIGALAYKWLLPLAPVLPWLIFFMLFFTFCKVNPLDLRLHKWHWVVLFAQITLSLGAYAATYLLTGSRFMAQGLMLCFIMPTATAAPIIAGKMGGSIQNLTTFTLLSNFATSLIVPATFPLINNNLELSTINSQLSTPELLSTLNSQLSTTFWPAFTLILSHIAPLLLGPFLLAWALRLGYRWKTKKEFVLPVKLAVIPFYLWVCSIVVLTAVVTQTVINNYHLQITNMLILLAFSFFACLLQFGLGKYIGYKLPAVSKGRDYQDVLINPAAAPKTMAGVSRITAGQAFGQKNTSLGVWMANTYLDPLASLGAAAYIIWQNLFNSAQLFIAAHKK